MAQDPVPFQLLGGHPVLDFVNTLDDRFAKGGPRELLIHFDDLVRFAEQSGLLSAQEIAPVLADGNRESRKEALVLARTLRESMADLLYKVVNDRESGSPASATQGQTPANLGHLNVLVRVSTSLRQLVWAGDPRAGRMAWEWTCLDTDLPLHKLVAAWADFLTSESVDLVRKCGNPACQWLFLDSGKRRGRRWCDMRVCGNRMKVKRYRSRVRQTGAA